MIHIVSSIIIMALIHLEYHSIALGQVVPICVYLPHDQIDYANYRYTESKPLKTLYLLHGLHGNENDWLMYGNVADVFRQHQIAVIMPAGLNSFYINDAESGRKFGDFIGKELVTMTRQMFHLSCKREDTWIAGLSMGGYGALRNGFTYYETFSIIGAFSPAIISKQLLTNHNAKIMGFDYYRLFSQSDADLFTLSSEIKGTKPLLYVACGSEDFLIDANRQFQKHLHTIGYPVAYYEEPGAHTWDFWQRHIVSFINYALDSIKS